MIDLQPIAPLISKVLRGQSYNFQEKYRWASFVCLLSVPKGLLAYNLLTKQLLLCKNHHEDEQMLVKNWFLIPESLNEFQLVTNVKNLLNKVNNQNQYIQHYTIFTTTDCNARCYYCFEKDAVKIRMTDTVINATVNFIQKHYTGKRISIQWFGGEPLFNIIAIDKICNSLNNAGINFTSHMTSNGFLFSNKVIQKAIRNWHLEKVQITLDGTENVYNKTKAYINNEGNPYQKVLHNIKLLLNHNIDVIIRLNLSQNNYSDLVTLVKELSILYGTHKNIKIYPTPLFELYKDKTIRKVIFKKLLELQNFIEIQGMELGYSYFHKIRLNHCKADNNLKSVVVFPNGNIGLCEHELDSKYIGNVWDFGSLNKNFVNEWSVYIPPQKSCSDCFLYFDCLKLKKCETNNSCYKEVIENDIHLIKSQMLKKYKKYETKIQDTDQ